jgi:hypothetical protein
MHHSTIVVASLRSAAGQLAGAAVLPSSGAAGPAVQAALPVLPGRRAAHQNYTCGLPSGPLFLLSSSVPPSGIGAQGGVCSSPAYPALQTLQGTSCAPSAGASTSSSRRESSGWRWVRGGRRCWHRSGCGHALTAQDSDNVAAVHRGSPGPSRGSWFHNARPPAPAHAVPAPRRSLLHRRGRAHAAALLQRRQPERAAGRPAVGCVARRWTPAASSSWPGCKGADGGQPAFEPGINPSPAPDPLLLQATTRTAGGSARPKKAGGGTLSRWAGCSGGKPGEAEPGGAAVNGSSSSSSNSTAGGSV